MLSGYFISSSVIVSVGNNKWNWRNYLINRFTRLYVVLIPALLIGVIWDQVGINLFENINIYSGESNESILQFSIVDRSTLLVFLSNLFFLQEILSAPFGSNGALWSLSYEFWYYIIFPFIVLSVYNRSWCYAIISVILFFFVGIEISIYFIIWGIGFLIFIFPPLNIKSLFIKYCLLSFSLFAFILSIIMSALQSIPFSDFIVAVFFGILVYLIISILDKPMKKNNINTIPKFLADFSYSLYLLHTPFIVFIYALYINLGYHKMQPNIKNIMIGIIFVIFIMIYAWLISVVTEKNTDKIKIKVKSIFNEYQYMKKSA
ncbi:acyltransferase [Bacillus infantis]|uniref:acyltransferase family protein n=1 Tax=Bacillus infantis TaxID=324767 RepID=UPI00101DF356|nr:acyltransferase [Bacillus infantis]RYI28771.1 acyltransferase [Bacillus infantis]